MSPQRPRFADPYREGHTAPNKQRSVGERLIPRFINMIAIALDRLGIRRTAYTLSVQIKRRAFRIPQTDARSRV